MPFEILRNVPRRLCLHCYIKNLGSKWSFNRTNLGIIWSFDQTVHKDLKNVLKFFVKFFAITLGEFLFELPHNNFGGILEAVFSLDAIYSVCVVTWLVLIILLGFYDKECQELPPPIPGKKPG